MKQIDELILIYEDEKGKRYKQFACDLVSQGTLIDPDGGVDMELIGFEIVDPAK